MKNKPLLTIAIPTWNRAEFLNNALKRLLPQVDIFYKEIELIISDNNSSDNTQIVIKRNINKYKQIKVNIFCNSKNLGYYGNFRRCKENANGIFFWLLSDNDYLEEGTLSLIINQIKENKNIGVIHLSYKTSKYFKKNQFYIKKKLSNDKFMTEGLANLSLISAVVFRNIIKDNGLLFNKFSDNSFLGFALLINTLRYFNENIIIYGKTLFIDSNAQFSFNVFNSFTHDMTSCLNYLELNKTINKRTISRFKNYLLKRIFRQQMLLYKIKDKSKNNKDFNIDEIYNLIKTYYCNCNSFIFYIIPVYYLPLTVLKTWNFLRRIINKIKSILVPNIWYKFLIFNTFNLKKFKYEK